MNIPNTLTLARIVLVPLVVWLIVTHEMTAAFVLFLLAGFSDAADGYLPSASNGARSSAPISIRSPTSCS